MHMSSTFRHLFKREDVKAMSTTECVVTKANADQSTGGSGQAFDRT